MNTKLYLKIINQLNYNEKNIFNKGFNIGLRYNNKINREKYIEIIILLNENKKKHNYIFNNIFDIFFLGFTIGLM